MKRMFRPVLLALLALVPTGMYAQDGEVDVPQNDDVEVSMSLAGEKKLSKKFSVGLEGEMRSRENATEFDRFSLSPSIEYKLAKHLKTTAGGAVIAMNNAGKNRYRSDGTLKWSRDSYWAPRYRAFVSLTGDTRVGRFNVALRERYQFTYRPEATRTRNYFLRDGRFNYSEDDIAESKTTQVLRSRLKVSYDIRKCPLEPFVGVEMTNNIDGFSVDKMRYRGGVDWKVSKKHAVSFTYEYKKVNGDDGEDDVTSHMIAVEYKFKL